MSKLNDNLNIFFLKDMSEDCVDAVIIAKTSTKEEIENAIKSAKQIGNYTWEDIIDALPYDCEIYDRWSSETIYY